ncbi:sigma-54 interaction domain-containing protein [Oscillospiraceae bacterium LTW-04]|nr:sigma 54-interacting transcriptional regulator [Oscillospiraceae bacterium MB24-C1]
MIDIKEYTHDRPLTDQAEEFINQGNYEVVISGTPCVETAKNMGKVGILFGIDPRMFEVALTNSQMLLQIETSREHRNKVVQAIMDYSSEGMIAVDSKDCITIMNHAAERLLSVNSKNELGVNIHDLLKSKRVVDVFSPETIDDREKGNIFVLLQKTQLDIAYNRSGSLYSLRDAQEIHELGLRAQKNMRLKGHIAKCTFSSIIGNSPAILRTKHLAKTFAQHDSTVLITGETGTGKELLAQSIHNSSLRKKQPFVAINCAALPENLLESELFGYVKGAFTGARCDGKQGVFEMASTGTLFLDEIGEITLSMQAQLLRVLQEKEIMRIGDDKLRTIDVRIIAATNKDLKRLVEKGHFREDLYYRLSVLDLHVPPLRERKEDIPPIIDALIRSKNRQLNKSILGVTNEVLNQLITFEWHGNIRELENFLEKLMIMSHKSIIDMDTFNLVYEYDEKSDVINHDKIKLMSLKQLEQDYISKVLECTKGNKTDCAKILEIDGTTLWRKLKSYEK